MALPVGSQFDLNRIPVLGFVPEQGTTAPANPVEGLFWNDTTNKVIKVYLNGSWTTLGTAGAGGPPSGSAGGDLTGTYPNPTIALLAVTDAKVAAANKDGVAGTPSMRTLGTGAQQAAAGNDSRFTDSRNPTGSAGGDLTGTYPNPTLATGAVDLTEIAAALKTSADGGTALQGAPALRRLGNATGEAMPGSTTLNNILAPSGPVSLNSQRITGLADPSSATDAANKQYVDGVAQGLDAKPSVKAATTVSLGDGTTPGGVQTIDGYTTGTSDRILVKNQSNPAFNGIYGTNTGGSWNRVADMDTWAEVPSAFVFVEQGTVNGDTGWVVTSDAGGTIGTTAITWTQFSGGGSLTAGAGMTQTGNVFDVVGTANRITANADSIDIASTYVGQSSITTLGTITTGTWTGTDIAVADGGTGSSTAAGARTNLGAVGKYAVTLGALTAGVETTITHNLNTTDVQAMFRDATSNNQILLSWRPITVNTAGVTADVAYGANAVKAVVMG